MKISSKKKISFPKYHKYNDLLLSHNSVGHPLIAFEFEDGSAFVPTLTGLAKYLTNLFKISDMVNVNHRRIDIKKFITECVDNELSDDEIDKLYILRMARK